MGVDNSFLANFGVWLGFALSLLLFSLLIRDNILARLAQHVLAGAAVGYIALVAWHEVLYPRLVVPLWNGQRDGLWVPALLGLVLAVAGLQRIVAQPYPQSGDARPLRQAPLWQRSLFNVGRLPVAVLLGAALGVGIVGAIEGTLWPQYLRAAQIAFDPAAPVGRMIIGLLTLVLTTGVMVHLYIDPARLAAPQPAFVRQTLLAWMWIGRHALWFAAGILFARLLAARMSLLIAQMQNLLTTLAESPFVMWLETLLGR